MLRMEDGAKENTALNIQKPLEILVTDEDKHGTEQCAEQTGFH